MPLHPLHNILKDSSDPYTDLMTYLPGDTLPHIQSHEYIDTKGELYLYDMIVSISRETGKFTGKGKIVSITDKHISITSRGRNIYLYPDDIYIFRKMKKVYKKQENREFFEALLHLF